MKKVLTIIIVLSVFITKTSAQQPVPVTDSLPLETDGLKMGYRILNEKEKEVGDKGDFSRYQLQFYVTNTSREAKMILYKQGFNLLGNDPSANLVQFNCVNATGARLTNKEATLQAEPCNLIASVDDIDCSTKKTKQNKRFVQIGYWIKAGQTISTKGIFIVPLNAKPEVNAVVLYNNNSLTGTVLTNSSNNNQLLNLPQGFLKLKNVSGNVYLNNQNGPANCSTIDNGWWSAQWKLVPVANTNYYLIKNRWKDIFLTNDPMSGFSSFSDQALNSRWIIEAVGNNYSIKNAGTNTYLGLQNVTLQCNNASNNSAGTQWVIEQ